MSSRQKYSALLAPTRQELTMNDTELQLREAIIAKCRWMNATGLNQGTSGNISARHGNTMLISPSATPYDPDTRHDRRDADRRRIWIVEGPTQALHRMALSPRHHEGATRRRRHRPYACDLLHRARDRTQGNSGVPLHDGRVRRHERARCRICQIRHQGAVGLCAQSTGRPDRLPARQSRNDRDRGITGQGDVARG